MSPSESGSLGSWWADVADGRFPPADGAVDVVAPDGPGWVIAEFTAHGVIAGDVTVDEVRAHGGDGFGGIISPAFVTWLAGRAEQALGPIEIGSHDAVLVRRGTATADAPATSLPVSNAFDDHPRVRRARHHRRDVSVFTSAAGLVAVGTGVGGRTEVSVELLDPATPAAGAGRELIALGLSSVPSTTWCFAQVSPGNARSVRSFLASGFIPVGAEILLTPRAADT